MESRFAADTHRPIHRHESLKCDEPIPPLARNLLCAAKSTFRPRVLPRDGQRPRSASPRTAKRLSGLRTFFPGHGVDAPDQHPPIGPTLSLLSQDSLRTRRRAGASVCTEVGPEKGTAWPEAREGATPADRSTARSRVAAAAGPAFSCLPELKGFRMRRTAPRPAERPRQGRHTAPKARN